MGCVVLGLLGIHWVIGWVGLGRLGFWLEVRFEFQATGLSSSLELQLDLEFESASF